jgi:hypothetical protein
MESGVGGASQTEAQASAPPGDPPAGSGGALRITLISSNLQEGSALPGLLSVTLPQVPEALFGSR